MFTDHISSDKTNTTSPSSRRIVQNVVDIKVVMLGSQIIQFFLEENIFFVYIGKDKVDDSLVFRMFADSTDNLHVKKCQSWHHCHLITSTCNMGVIPVPPKT